MAAMMQTQDIELSPQKRRAANLLDTHHQIDGTKRGRYSFLLRLVGLAASMGKLSSKRQKSGSRRSPLWVKCLFTGQKE